MLTKLEWKILEGISYDSEEPIEYVDGLVLETNPEASAYETLDILFNLYQKEFVEFYQIPIQALNQNDDFERKMMIPSKPIEIIGDLWNQYKEFSQKRDYLEKIHDTGVPLGIYVCLTQKGLEEIKKDDYLKYNQS